MQQKCSKVKISSSAADEGISVWARGHRVIPFASNTAIKQMQHLRHRHQKSVPGRAGIIEHPHCVLVSYNNIGFHSVCCRGRALWSSLHTTNTRLIVL